MTGRSPTRCIDLPTGAHLRADHFDGRLEDVFDLQDEVIRNVIGAISLKLEQAEIERAKRKPAERLAAHDYLLQGMASIWKLPWLRHRRDVGLLPTAATRAGSRGPACNAARLSSMA
jgi:hypothetical protein